MTDEQVSGSGARPWWRGRWGALAAVAAVVVVGLGTLFAMKLLGGEPAAPAKTATAIDLSQVHGLPTGAVACAPIYTDVTTPFNSGARGTPMTSCPFVEQIRRAFSTQRPTSTGTYDINVVSPATRKWYDVVCTRTGDFATCTGGQGALIYLYNS